MDKNYQPVTDAIEVVVGGSTYVATQKLFSTGSRGFYGNGKAVINVGGGSETDLRRYQVAITITEIGSKGTSTGPRPDAPRLAPATK